METFQQLQELTDLALQGGQLFSGASDAIERLFSEPGFRVWYASVRETEIRECGEPLVEIPEAFPRILPHAYVRRGAPYGKVSPFFLRRGVVERLAAAQAELAKLRPGHRLTIFDGYRPMAVQRYLVQCFFDDLVQERGIDLHKLSETEIESLYNEVFQILARPNDNPKTPTPHSTGGAVDLTILDADGQPLPMGSAIDAMPPECLPSYYTGIDTLDGRRFAENRALLHRVMNAAGFHRLPQEWWHFSFGDQAWAVLEALERKARLPARYGRADLLPREVLTQS